MGVKLSTLWVEWNDRALCRPHPNPQLAAEQMAAVLMPTAAKAGGTTYVNPVITLPLNVQSRASNVSIRQTAF